MKSSLNKSYSLILVLFLSTALYAAPYIVPGGNNKTTTRGKCEYSLYDKLLLQQQYWYKPNSAVFHNPSWVVADYNSEDRIYVKWKNIKASAYPQIISADFWNFRGNESYDSLSIPAFTLTMPTPSFTAGTSLNIPCYITNATTISLNSYINSDAGSVGIDQNEVITDEFEWTLPTGWQTSTGQTGTFVSSSSISVIPPASSATVSISVKAKANTQYSQPATIQITRNLNNFSVSGDTPVLFNSTHRYEVPLYSGVSYSWQLPNGWAGSSTTNYIDVTVGCASGTIITATMTGCNQSKSASLTIINNYINPGSQIIGDDIVCLAGNIFEISPNPPTGTTISWNSSFNLTQTAQSGSTATYSANGSGTGWIEATVTIPGCTSITLPRKSTWMSDYYFHVTRPDGIPVTTDQYGNLSFCSYTDYTIEMRPTDEMSCYTSDQSWTIPSTWTTNYNNGSTISINTNGDPNNYISVDAKNCCYEDVYLSYYFEYSSSCSQYLMVFSPNPSISETTLSISTKSGTKINDDLEWDLEVYDSMQSQKTKINKIKGDKQTINTSSWKDGVYIVRVKIEKEMIIGKLAVKH